MCHSLETLVHRWVFWQVRGIPILLAPWTFCRTIPLSPPGPGLCALVTFCMEAGKHSSSVAWLWQLQLAFYQLLFSDTTLKISFKIYLRFSSFVTNRNDKRDTGSSSPKHPPVLLSDAYMDTKGENLSSGGASPSHPSWYPFYWLLKIRNKKKSNNALSLKEAISLI
jgi:hypothetical protein